MSLEKYFCSSPWFHMTILNDGSYSFCRWSTSPDKLPHKTDKIQNQHPIQWFQNSSEMAGVRKKFLNNESYSFCQDCTLMEKHKKVSGREKQLLKTGIASTNFEKTFLSSSWIKPFKQSYYSKGHTDQYPIDWQINLGNFCNSGCVFCHPSVSSKLASDFRTIGILNHDPIRSWTDDTESFDKFLDTISMIPNIRYLHFIGGEPLFMPTFKTILKNLIKQNRNKSITIGFTTNLTIYNQEIVDLLENFDVHIGLSIECLDELNDYVRYGSKINQVKENLNHFVELSKKNNWTCSIRTTPTFLTVRNLLPLYQYALDNKVHIESCNFLSSPEIFKPSVLPEPYKSHFIKEMSNWILSQSQVTRTEKRNINTRSNYLVEQTILQDAESYLNYFKKEKDESFLLPKSLEFLKKLEKIRNNKILDYLPEYEEIFRTAGY